jgi:hypothetical protein
MKKSQSNKQELENESHDDDNGDHHQKKNDYQKIKKMNSVDEVLNSDKGSASASDSDFDFDSNNNSHSMQPNSNDMNDSWGSDDDSDDSPEAVSFKDLQNEAKKANQNKRMQVMSRKRYVSYTQLLS